MAHDIELETAKSLIIRALNDFDPELGQRAAQILTDELRANIYEADAPKTGMMVCRPAGISIDDLQRMGMYILDYEERFAPFTSQENPKEYAIVDYEYVGTTDSVIYLAHEVGHAIADDMQREKGLSFRDFSTGQLEKQAYFVQSIFQDYLHEHGADHGIEYQKPEQGGLQSSWARAAQLKAADNTFQRASHITDPSVRSNFVVAALTENTDENGSFLNAPVVTRALQATHP